ncbi:MAG TPA: peptidyl-prolyl cis-trans isomerase [Candidatus Angelobacter sp.]|nr:peptidyl-prolyl cis-trans isomerase [Candidatus Angelobacter sp.]
MIRRLIICLLIASAALAQTSKKQKPASPAATPTASPTPQATPPTLLKRDERPAELPPDAAVISVRGLCPADTSPAITNTVPSTKDCNISVSKQQFDNLVKSFNTNNQAVTPAQRRGLGEKYVELLVFSEAAKAAGIENTPTYVEVMRVLRLKTLGDLYLNQLAEEYRNPSQQEIEAYYQGNQQKFEGAKLSRIYIPTNIPDPQATAEKKQDYQKKVQQVVDDTQARATKGEEMSKLQKDAYVALGITAAPPSTDLSLARHGTFPPKIDQEIFSHKAGDVFRSDDGTGHMIYRVESRQTSPLESVKAEIVQQIYRQKMEAKTKELNAPVHAEFDEKYFGPPVAPTPPGPAPLPPNPAK